MVIIPSRGIFNWPRQTATTTLDEVTIEEGHRGHDLSSAPDKRPVWTNWGGLGQTQTLVPDQFGMRTLPAASVRLLG